MRIPSLSSLCLVMCLSSTAHAGLSLSDLPYIQGTPVAEGNWEIQDYAQSGEGIQWVWLQQGDQAVYVVYPSEGAVLLPDNSQIAAASEQMTLLFTTPSAQELVFSRFGSAQFSVLGERAEVRYTAMVGNTAEGIYTGDLHIDAKEIHIDGELELEGDLSLAAEEMLALYGAIAVQGSVSVKATAGVIMGTLKQHGTVMFDACGIYTNLADIQFDSIIKTKGCAGDFVAAPTAETGFESATSAPEAQALATEPAKGGNLDHWVLFFLAALAGFVFRK